MYPTIDSSKKELSKMREFRRPSVAPPLTIIEENKCIETFEPKVSQERLHCNGIKENCLTEECNKSGENESDLETLKVKATQLKLKTRRPSYVTWTSQCIIDSGSLIKPRLNNSYPDQFISTPENDEWTEERRDKINEALSWIRNQLHEMRIMDQDLARRLLDLRHEIHEFKLKRSCDEHKEMIEDAHCDIEEMNELQVICDIPLEMPQPDDLKRIGLTKMNISSRRFSMC